ncbi:MAG: protoporphyrinogen oxidase HemJ [Alphaproteobacteria bacterium]
MGIELYQWVKAVHLIAVISWMAGLLYLPRLFVYHADAEPGSAMSETFKVMERRLLRAIMNPAMIVTWAAGLLMLHWSGVWTEGWMHAKLALVIGLTAMHMAMASWRRAFAEDRNRRPARFYRIANEVPTVAMILIVVLVIVQPF